MTNQAKPGARGVYRDGLKKINAESGPGYQEAFERISNFIRDFWIANGYSPTVNEIAEQCGYHRASVSYWTHRMREKSDLLFDDKVARSFRLPGQTVNFPD